MISVSLKTNTFIRLCLENICFGYAAERSISVLIILGKFSLIQNTQIHLNYGYMHQGDFIECLINLLTSNFQNIFTPYKNIKAMKLKYTNIN